MADNSKADKDDAYSSTTERWQLFFQSLLGILDDCTVRLFLGLLSVAGRESLSVRLEQDVTKTAMGN